MTARVAAIALAVAATLALLACDRQPRRIHTLTTPPVYLAPRTGAEGATGTTTPPTTKGDTTAMTYQPGVARQRYLELLKEGEAKDLKYGALGRFIADQLTPQELRDLLREYHAATYHPGRAGIGPTSPTLF